MAGHAHAQITLSDGGSGDTLRTWQLKGEPLEVAVARCKDDGGGMVRKQCDSDCVCVHVELTGAG